MKIIKVNIFIIILFFIEIAGLQAQIVTDINGNVYKTVTIGTQTWMAENLKVTRYRNGDSIPNYVENWSDTIGAYCDFDNNPENSIIYGRLYNWYAVSDSRNIAPLGWHMATNADWVTLIAYLEGDSLAGGKLKETGIDHWTNPNIDADNTTGFTALPGGLRRYDGTFDDAGDYCYWWSSTARYAFGAYYRYLFHESGEIHRGHDDKALGLSVRCLRDTL